MFWRVCLKMTKMYKLLWDFSAQTDHEIGARRPDLIIIDKKNKRCQIRDVAIPEGVRVREKEDEKVEKYKDLVREVGKMKGVRTKVFPGVVGALASMPLRLNNNLITTEVSIPVELIQRCALLGSLRILRKVLEIEREEKKTKKGASLGFPMQLNCCCQ